MDRASRTTTADHDIIIRPLQSGDEAGWRELYMGYAAFYQVEMNDAILKTTWSWLMNAGHPLEGLVASQAAQPIGLAHFRAQPKPLLGENAGFLDDLFVRPESRGAGAGKLLIGAIAAIARRRGWSTVRWITAEDNVAARRLYDQVANATSWLTYELRP